MIRFAKDRFITDPGSSIRDVYKLKFSIETGAEELFKVGEENFQAYIESFAESCDLGVIIRRINAGEVDLLSANLGSYGDFTGVPTDVHALYQVRIDAMNTWNMLSESAKKEFGTFEDFASTAGSKEWLEKLGVKFEESEVVADAES